MTDGQLQCVGVYVEKHLTESFSADSGERDLKGIVTIKNVGIAIRAGLTTLAELSLKSPLNMASITSHRLMSIALCPEQVPSSNLKTTSADNEVG